MDDLAKKLKEMSDWFEYVVYHGVRNHPAELLTYLERLAKAFELPLTGAPHKKVWESLREDVHEAQWQIKQALRSTKNKRDPQNEWNKAKDHFSKVLA